MPNSGSDMDLKDLRKDFNISVTSRETSKEIDARIRREDAEAEHLRKKELIILWMVVVLVGFVSFVCVVVMFLPHSSVDNVKWATTLLTTVVAGGVGYMTGKGSRS